MRLSLALFALFLCAGCNQKGGADDAFTDSRIPPALGRQFLPPQGWAWGLIQTKDAPPIRYGVAAPPVRPRGDVLILCGYGESAEAWFETANHLVSKGYAVWIMDPAGQGGSGRFTRPRDLGHAPDFTADVAGLRAMTTIIGRPAVLIAQSTSAPSALTALVSGLRVRGVVLSDPVADSSGPPLNAALAAHAAPTMRALQLGWLRAQGQKPWVRTDPLPPGRPGVIPAWQAANPDLRMGGPSFGYIAAFAQQAGALTPGKLAAIAAPVLVLQPDHAGPAPRSLCGAIPGCTLQTVAEGRGSLHLETAAYEPWSKAVDAMLLRSYPPF